MKFEEKACIKHIQLFRWGVKPFQQTNMSQLARSGPSPLLRKERVAVFVRFQCLKIECWKQMCNVVVKPQLCALWQQSAETVKEKTMLTAFHSCKVSFECVVANCGLRALFAMSCTRLGLHTSAVIKHLRRLDWSHSNAKLNQRELQYPTQQALGQLRFCGSNHATFMFKFQLEILTLGNRHPR